MADFMINMSMEFLLPFLFVLAIVFGSIELTGVFKNKGVHLIIAFVIAFFAATYQPFTTVLWKNMGIMVWFFIAMFFIAFIGKIMGLRGGKVPSESIIVYSVVLFVLLAVGWTAIEQLNIELPYIGGGENLALVIGLIVIGIIFFLATKFGHVQLLEQRYASEQKGKGG